MWRMVTSLYNSAPNGIKHFILNSRLFVLIESEKTKEWIVSKPEVISMCFGNEVRPPPYLGHHCLQSSPGLLPLLTSFFLPAPDMPSFSSSRVLRSACLLVNRFRKQVLYFTHSIKSMILTIESTLRLKKFFLILQADRLYFFKQISTLHLQFSKDQKAQRERYPKWQPTMSWLDYLELIKARKFK